MWQGSDREPGRGDVVVVSHSKGVTTGKHMYEYKDGELSPSTGVLKCHSTENTVHCYCALMCSSVLCTYVSTSTRLQYTARHLSYYMYLHCASLSVFTAAPLIYEIQPDNGAHKGQSSCYMFCSSDVLCVLVACAVVAEFFVCC